MTIAKTIARAQYAGNGSTTPFSFPYRFFADVDLQVYLQVDATGIETLQTLTTHYTVSNNGDETGGTVTMVTAPANGETLTILRAIAQTQSTDYAANDAFPAETHEVALDRLTLLVQQLQEKVDRALVAQASDTASLVLPSDLERASKYLAFDASSVPIAATAPEGGNVVSAFMATMLDDPDASTARATIGAGTMDDVVDDVTPQLGGPLDTNSQIVKWSKGADVAAAGTTTLGDDGNCFEITGSTGITGFTAKAIGTVVKLRFTGTPAITNGANLEITGGTFTAAAGDTAELEMLTATKWIMRPTRISGAALSGSHTLQVVSTLYTTSTTGTTALPYDNTVPQNTEGDEYFTLAITPISATSTLVIEVVVYGTPAGGGNDQVGCALFQDTTAAALAAAGYDSHSNGGPGQMIIKHTMTSGTTSSTTFKVRAGRDGGNTFRINGDSILGTRLFGGVLTSSITITEIE